MAEQSENSRHALTSPVASASLAWRIGADQLREQIARIETAREIRSTLPANDAIEELSATLEELEVAESELRAQSDAIEESHAHLVAEHARNRSLFEHAPIAYVVTDAQGAIVDANRAASELLAARPQSLHRKPLFVFAHEVSRRRLRLLVSSLGMNRPTATIRFNLLTRSAGVVRAEASVAAGLDSRGRVVELRWLISDQTRRWREERQRRHAAMELERLVEERTADLEQERRLKDRLVANVSHEFRTVLSAIGGYAELLELGIRGPLNDAQARDVRLIQRAYHHLAGIVDDLLSYSKIMSGGIAIDDEDVQIADAIESTAIMLESHARAKEISLDRSGIDPSCVVRGDAERVRQILLNVLGNAIKFTPDGGSVTIRVRCDETHVDVQVDDTGPGIPDGKSDVIFDAFVRLEPSTQGTGLGLPISRELARAMHGDLYAEQADGGGRFVLRLPRSTSLAVGAGPRD